MTNANGGERPPNRIVKVAFGAAALGCVLTGLVIYLFAPSVGIDAGTAEIIAIAFLAAGLLDYLLLRFWDRIMPPSR